MPKLFYFIQHTASFHGNTGIQRVTRYLGRALGEIGRDVVCVSWLAEARALTRASDVELRGLARWGGPTFRAAGAPPVSLESDPAVADDVEGSWLLIPELPYHSGADLTLGLIEYAHRIGLKIAFVFYDLIPVSMRGYESFRPAHVRYVEQMALADLVLPISRYCATELERHYLDRLGLPYAELPEIVPCPLPEEVPDWPRPEAVADPSGPTIDVLCLGRLEPRKNQKKLLIAFNRLCAKRPDLDLGLTLIGDHDALALGKLRGAMRRNPRIVFAGALPDEEVFARYRDCYFTVFPSVEEGFGLPIVESLWFGKPCLCANFGAMAEAAAGGGCLTVDTRSVAALAGGLEQLSTDGLLREKLAREAMSRPMRSWRDHAAQVARALDRHIGVRRAAYWVDFTARHPINTGVQRVTRSLARGLEDRGVALDYVLWDYTWRCFAPPDAAQRAHLAQWNGPRRAGSGGLADTAGQWLVVPEILSKPPPAEVIRHARALGMGIAFLFHDIIPVKHPATFGPELVASFVGWCKMMLDADVVVPNSAATGADLVDFYARECARLPAELGELVEPCPLAGEFMETPRVREVRVRDGGAASLLCVGTIDPRKNQLMLVEAIRGLRRSQDAGDISLTIVGTAQSYPDLAGELRRQIADLPGVEFLDYVDDRTLQALYGRSDFTVYASYEEGFGLPILESLWNARPCLCHDAGAIAEVAAGGGCLMLDMHDVAALGAGIFRLARDHELYRRLAREAVTRPIKTWADYAGEIARILARRMARPSARVRALGAFRPPSLWARIPHPATLYAGLLRSAYRRRILPLRR